ncbi:hypothetical protein HAX54_049671, partial [Datura stramonium]|nr:hypothetical protein [Datura stramonium]
FLLFSTWFAWGELWVLFGSFPLALSVWLLESLEADSAEDDDTTIPLGRGVGLSIKTRRLKGYLGPSPKMVRLEMGWLQMPP